MYQWAILVDNDKERERKIIIRAKCGDEKAVMTLINNHKKMLQKMICKCKYNSQDNNDAYQYGIIGIMEAIKHYDLQENTKFSTYLYFWIKKYLSYLSQHVLYDEPKSLGTRITLGEELYGSNKEEERYEDNETIEIMLSVLDVDEKEIIEKIFGINGEEKLTLQELSIITEKPVCRLRRIKNVAIQKMKAKGEGEC